jgi:tRNA pseudouridine38-40 synthase
MRFRAILAYDGTAYQGFQKQAGDRPTVQAAVERALAVISGRAVTVYGAGRTDSGVHATGQVIAFDLDWVHGELALIRALNANLPGDIAVQEAEATWDDFHPRFDARSRLYEYTVLECAHRQPLLRDRAWQIRCELDHGCLDLSAMNNAARRIMGEHDFAAFGQPPEGTVTVRTVYQSRWDRQGRALIYTVEANAFLQHMVRRLVGALVEVGRGRITPGGFAEILASRDLGRVRVVAPPQGLCLVRVRYTPDAGITLDETGRSG